MNIWIIYDSKFGNNKKIANLLAEYFNEGNNVQVHYAKEISPKRVADEGVDVFLFGGPLRMGNISYTMKKWATKLGKILSKRNVIAQKAAVWGSHATNGPDTPPKFAWESSKMKWKALLDIFPAEKKLPEVIGFDIKPETLEGPLESGWEEIVKSFAEKVKNL